ncbi:MAG: polysaccharide pyruvyl transferase family protein [Candidatus Peribacteraceae bacterium]|nr:polysaccharide pyruvyl transferase family protein [Candidatus Peribacteraceae bacterium]MDD5075202.1 polysaccharide pyruvyl transferase family protein [Candidatus Peribacteraceae bacterium]
MKLLHLQNWRSTNIGNGALAFGTERVLREDLGKDLQFTPEPWDEYVIENTFGARKFDAGFVDLVNAHDGLLVGGAVTFNGRPHLTEAGMRFNLPLSLWTHIRVPVIFYGNSYRFWPKATYHNVEKLRETVRYIIETPRIFFGVRNDGTKEFLESLLGLRSDRIVPVPDPGMYVPVEEHDYPEFSSVRKNILLSINNEDESDRFPDAAGKTKFLESFAKALERIAEAFDVNFVLCPHAFDDYKIIAQLLDLLPPKIVHQRTLSTGLLPVPKAPYFYGRYARADLAMSMRIHSLSPAIGLGIPVIPLVSQNRVSAFLENIGLGDLGVDVFGADVEEQVFAKAAGALAHPDDATRKIRNAAAHSRQQTAAINDRVRQLLLHRR